MLWGGKLKYYRSTTSRAEALSYGSLQRIEVDRRQQHSCKSRLAIVIKMRAAQKGYRTRLFLEVFFDGGGDFGITTTEHSSCQEKQTRKMHTQRITKDSSRGLEACWRGKKREGKSKEAPGFLCWAEAAEQKERRAGIRDREAHGSGWDRDADPWFEAASQCRNLHVLHPAYLTGRVYLALHCYGRSSVQLGDSRA